MTNFNIANESGAAAPISDRVREECIIALKVYDFCRQQQCNYIQQMVCRCVFL